MSLTNNFVVKAVLPIVQHATIRECTIYKLHDLLSVFALLKFDKVLF